MRLRKWLAGIAVSTLTSLSAFAADPVAPAPTKSDAPKATVAGFGTVRGLTASEAKIKVETYLKSAGKHDQTKVDEIWKNEDRTILDRTVESIALAMPEAAKLLADVRSVAAVPPTEVPALLKNDKLDPFVRANVSAAYAKALASKKIYEEAIATAALIKSDELVDPSAFYFFKAVAEHGVAGTDKTLKRNNREAAVKTILTLLDDVTDSPDRYKMVATLMFFDIQAWSKDPKDLGNIGKLMDNSGRRLDLARGDDETQRIQKDIVFRLDEKIKELEQKAKGGGSWNGDGCPSGGQPGQGGTGGKNPNGPAASSSLPSAGAKEGKVDEKQLRQYAETWGKLPASERAKAVQEITRDLPPKYKVMIEDYFRALSKAHGLDK